MPDKWAQFAQPTADAGGDKWTQYAQTATPAPVGDWRSNFENKYIAPQTAPPNETTGQHILRGISNFGGGVIGGVTEPFLHPLDAIKGAAEMGSAALSGNPYNIANALHVPELAQSVHDHPEEATESALGSAGGGMLLGEGAGLAGRAVAPLGAPLERAGLELGNNALGARGPKPFKYDANPARGAYDEGVLPAISKHSASVKLERALPDAGQRISDAVMNSGGSAPAGNIANSIEKPITDAGNVMSGFGGGKPLDPVTNLWASMEEKAPNAGAPIYGRGAPPDVTAPDLWQSIRNLDKNTRFNPDPEVEGVNELRRDVRGGLRGNLEDAVPGLKPLTQRYQDLSGAQEAIDRTMHSGGGLRRAMEIPTFPLESAAGKALYSGGKAVANAGDFAHSLGPIAPVTSLMSTLRDEEKKEQ